MHRHAAMGGHAALPLILRVEGENVQLCDLDGGMVATLLAEGGERWRDRLEEFESLRVLALTERRAEDSEGAYRSQLCSERWELPVVEVVYLVA